jgi:hypothetical protein
MISISVVTGKSVDGLGLYLTVVVLRVVSRLSQNGFIFKEFECDRLMLGILKQEIEW